jgi:hypothetical protein
MEIKINVTRMFDEHDPWDVSNSVANLGANAAELTWANAQAIAKEHEEWLLSPLAETLDAIRENARATGAWDFAWDDDELAAWSDMDLLAYLAQTVASDMRLLGSDDHDFAACLAQQEATDWDAEPEYPLTSLYIGDSDDIFAEAYLGI